MSAVLAYKKTQRWNDRNNFNRKFTKMLSRLEDTRKLVVSVNFEAHIYPAF